MVITAEEGHSACIRGFNDASTTLYRNLNTSTSSQVPYRRLPKSPMQKKSWSHQQVSLSASWNSKCLLLREGGRSKVTKRCGHATRVCVILLNSPLATGFLVCCTLSFDSSFTITAYTSAGIYSTPGIPRRFSSTDPRPYASRPTAPQTLQNRT